MKSQWWYREPARLETEKALLDAAGRKLDWLDGLGISINDDTGDIQYECDLLVGGEKIPLVMVYPPYYPSTGPAVFPKEERRLSYHQYGSAGELCLELRPDTWDEQSHTGLEVIKSAYKLLSGEHGKLLGSEAVVDAHEQNPATACKGEHFRWILPFPLLDVYRNEPFATPSPLKLAAKVVGNVTVCQIASVGSSQNKWSPGQHSEHEDRLITGYCVSVPEGVLSEKPSFDDLVDALKKNGYGNLVSQLLPAGGGSRALLIVTRPDRLEVSGLRIPGSLTQPQDWQLALLMGSGELLWPHQIFDDTDPSLRKPQATEQLSNVRVAVVGCGSIGSKVAASLARHGVSNFLLVDPDIMLAGNVIRHELDHTMLGFDKVEALGDRIRALNPSALVETLPSAIGGQIAMSLQGGLMKVLGEVDLIVDVTAEPRVFQYLAHVAAEAKVPMIWGQIFAGGIGGEVMRARPDLDPPPLYAKAQADAWYAKKAPALSGVEYVGRYEGVSGGTPVIALDAEISVVAGYLAGFATDILLSPEVSKFPYSAYAIGFSNEWLFEQPFMVQPISYSLEGVWGHVERDHSDDEIKALARCFGKWPLS
jgi:molybdopterin/thiamine biosynthesis adenylyltransferase